jgi:putative transposase
LGSSFTGSFGSKRPSGKAKLRIQRIHARIADARADFLHKASNSISKNHAMITLEDLKICNISKSAKGTADMLALL